MTLVDDENLTCFAKHTKPQLPLEQNLPNLPNHNYLTKLAKHAKPQLPKKLAKYTQQTLQTQPHHTKLTCVSKSIKLNLSKQTLPTETYEIKDIKPNLAKLNGMEWIVDRVKSLKKAKELKP